MQVFPVNGVKRKGLNSRKSRTEKISEIYVCVSSCLFAVKTGCYIIFSLIIVANNQREII